ncbi:MAG: amidohydrolase family protein [Bryobacteraceae bacterium]
MGTTLIRGARQLLTVRGPRGPRCGPALKELGVIQDGALLIRDGVIAEVGPTRRVENLGAARQAEEINAAGRVVMPGFVDSHTHLILPPAGGGDDVARAIRAIGGLRLKMRAQGCLQAMARNGTTTVEVKTGCGPDSSGENKVLRVLANLKSDPLEVVPTFLFRLPPSADEGQLRSAAEWAVREMLPRLRKRRLARFADLAWEAGAERAEIFARYLDAAHRLGFGVKMHADGLGVGAAVVMAVGRFATSIDHLECASAAEAALLAGSCTIATLLPCEPFQNGTGDAPARDLIDAGAAVALASNFNPRLSPMPNMQTVVELACLRMGMTAAEAISAATINGAHALGRADRIGSLELGKYADVLILNVSDYRELARGFGTNLVRTAIKRGERIYEEGEVSGPEATLQQSPRTGPGNLSAERRPHSGFVPDAKGW